MNKTTKSSIFSQSFLNVAPIVCSLMVIIIHQHRITDNARSISSRLISFFTHGICTAAVPTFFLISGFLFYRNVFCMTDVFHKQKKRVTTTLVPFVAWSSFYYLLYAVVSYLLPGRLQSAVNVSLTGIVRGILFYEYAFLMWFMFQLCVYIILAPLIYSVLKNKIMSVVLLLTSALLSMFGPKGISVSWESFERDLFQFNFFTYYFLGCVLAKHDTARKSVLKICESISTAAWAAMFIISSLLGSVFFDGLWSTFNTRCMVPLVFVSFVFLLSKLCQSVPNFPRLKLSTMIVYGIHPAIGMVLNEVVFDRIEIHAVLAFVLSVIGVGVGSIGAAWCMQQIKPINRVFGGNR